MYFQYMCVVYNNLSRLQYQIASMNKSDFFTWCYFHSVKSTSETYFACSLNKTYLEKGKIYLIENALLLLPFKNGVLVIPSCYNSHKTKSCLIRERKFSYKHWISSIYNNGSYREIFICARNVSCPILIMYTRYITKL